MSAFEDLWERLKQIALDIASERLPTEDECLAVVRRELRRLGIEGDEQVPEEATRFFASSLFGFVEAARTKDKTQP